MREFFQGMSEVNYLVSTHKAIEGREDADAVLQERGCAGAKTLWDTAYEIAAANSVRKCESEH